MWVLPAGGGANGGSVVGFLTHLLFHTMTRLIKNTILPRWKNFHWNNYAKSDLVNYFKINQLLSCVYLEWFKCSNCAKQPDSQNQLSFKELTFSGQN